MIYSLDAAVKVKMFGHVSQKHGRWHNGSKSSNSTVVYCTDGEINMQVGDDVFHLDTGDLLLLPPDILFKPLDGGSCKYYFFNFEAAVLPETMDLPRYISILPHKGLVDGHAYSSIGSYRSASRVAQFIKNAPYRIKAIFERGDQLHPEKHFSDQLLLDNLMRELLIQMGMDRAPRLSTKLAEILDYVHQHYSKKITLSALADRFFLSESYIARLFKKELGCKPSEYVNNLKISMAQTLLAETNLSVTETAERLGYSDVYYFSKVFKQIAGTTPSALKKETESTGSNRNITP